MCTDHPTGLTVTQFKLNAWLLRLLQRRQPGYAFTKLPLIGSDSSVREDTATFKRHVKSLRKELIFATFDMKTGTLQINY
ncbi:hypothetical protein F2P81_000856 [Scophthalmus maximus]|uniref:Uncharacterized protein n=1 Tax=Scophthalmus maximus TaxID=52904 RepID=A0A6A4TM55_SCOMX|nr:hypothetical protein F2P81_000856 [Scophthalmus maximus]